MEKDKICAELVFILEQIPYTYNQRIPVELKENLKNNMSEEHYKSFNKDKVFHKQNISSETTKVLIDLLVDYWVEDKDNITIEDLFK